MRRACWPQPAPSSAAARSTRRPNTSASMRRGIAEANGSDLSAAEKSGMSHAMLDRLHLNDERIEAMAKGVEVVANLPDPLGRTLWETTRPNGHDDQRGSACRWASSASSMNRGPM